MDTSNRRAWVITVLLALGGFIAYVDRSSLSVALALQTFKDTFHLTEIDRGWLSAAFFVSYASIQIPAGWLVDRWGVKWPYAAGFLLWACAAAATALAASTTQLFSLRLLLGVGEAVVAPATMRWVRQNFNETNRGVAISVYLFGVSAGLAIGVPLAASLSTAYGWRPMFALLGLSSLIWLIPWIILVPQERVSEGSGTAGGSSGDVVTVLRRPAFIGVILGTFCYNYFLYFCMTWMPTYLMERGKLPVNRMGSIMMIAFGGMALTSSVSGAVTDRLIRRGYNAISVRKRFAMAGLLLGSVEVGSVAVSSERAAVGILVFSLIGLGVATTNCWALTHSVVPAAMIGRVIGVQNLIANLAGVAAPLVTGALNQRTPGYKASLWMIWMILAGGIAAYGFLVKPQTQKVLS